MLPLKWLLLPDNKLTNQTNPSIGLLFIHFSPFFSFSFLFVYSSLNCGNVDVYLQEMCIPRHVVVCLYIHYLGYWGKIVSSKLTWATYWDPGQHKKEKHGNDQMWDIEKKQI